MTRYNTRLHVMEAIQSAASSLVAYRSEGKHFTVLVAAAQRCIVELRGEITHTAPGARRLISHQHRVVCGVHFATDTEPQLAS